jgi:conjugation system TraG family ATPase
MKIESIFPLLAVQEDGLMVSKNADIAFAYELSYPEIFITSQNQYMQAYTAILSACKSLGEHVLVHKQDIFCEAAYTPNYEDLHDPVLRENERVFADKPYLEHKAYLYIIWPSSNPMKRESPQSSLFKKSIVPKHLQNKAAIPSFQEKCSSFASTLQLTGILSIRKILKKELCEQVLQTYFGLSFSDPSLSDISTIDGLSIGGKYSATYVLNDLDQFPSELNPVNHYRDLSSDKSQLAVSNGMAFGLNLPFNHVYNQIFYIPNQQELATRKMEETKRHFSFSQWSRDNTFSFEQKTRFVDTMKTGGVAVHAHFNIQVFSADKKQLQDYKNTTAAAINNAGFVPKLANATALQIYWSCIPGNASELGSDNFSTCLLSNACSLYSLETSYRESMFHKNGILLTDREGQPRYLDLFFEPMKKGLINNRNFSVVGPSGSGKSFTMNNIIYYVLQSGAHITVVDIGHSYRRLGEILGAKYMEHTEDNPIRLNPFRIHTKYISEEQMEVIARIVFLIYKKDDERISKQDEVSIYLMVSEYYKYLEKQPKIVANFNSFFEFVQEEFDAIFALKGGRNEKDFSVSSFLYVCQAFYRGGQYDYLLNSEEETDLSQYPFVIYELDNIKDHPILLPIITLMITNTYVSQLFGVRNKLKVLLIEEAWRAVSSPFFAEFLLWAFKTARKHLGAIGVVTQEIDDLLKSDIIKDAIVQNTDIKILMDLRKYEEHPEKILDLFKISNAHAAQIFSINKGQQSNRGKYKELAVILGSYCKVYGVEVSKAAYALFTTEATEVDAIKKIAEDKEISQYEAAMEWAKN